MTPRDHRNRMPRQHPLPRSHLIPSPNTAKYSPFANKSPISAYMLLLQPIWDILFFPAFLSLSSACIISCFLSLHRDICWSTKSWRSEFLMMPRCPSLIWYSISPFNLPPFLPSILAFSFPPLSPLALF